MRIVTSLQFLEFIALTGSTGLSAKPALHTKESDRIPDLAGPPGKRFDTSP